MQKIFEALVRNLRAAKPAFFVIPSKFPVQYRQYIRFSNGTT